ncbi:hypothetical protein GOV04_00670 [Candidatus Woesearchaeota archaeon]|nr:hypothetical protein [Candidatus Woesearchaeota archaeon]
MLNIKFKISKKYDIETLQRFALPGRGDWDWSGYVFDCHPILKKELEKVKTRKDKLQVIQEYVQQYHKNNNKKLEKRKKELRGAWEKINNEYEQLLKKILELKKASFKLTAYVTISPICPRDLQKKDFAVSYQYNNRYAKLAIAHEVLHFYYFKKWKEVFPRHSEKSFDGPHIIWHLSEILAVVLLNTSKFFKILRAKEKGYQEHQKIKVRRRTILEYFSDLYTQSQKNNQNFEQFLKQSYKTIKQHENHNSFKG